MHWIKVEPHYVEAQGPPLSTGVSFVRIDPGDWKLPQDNQRVSSSVFQRSPIIIVVGYRIQVDYWNIGILGIFFYDAPFLRKKAYDVCCKRLKTSARMPFLFPFNTTT